MPECALCGEDVPRRESRLPFVSRDNTVALAHAGCPEGDRLSFLRRSADVERATHVCEGCEGDVETRRVQVTRPTRETELRKQFRCPRCGHWTPWEGDG